jgi:hypothetical protein
MKKEKIENWVELVRHINDSWVRRMNKPHVTAYPFTGKDWKDLAHFARQLTPYGLMALWDVYLEKADRKRGYTLWGFQTCLPWLMDSDYKVLSKIYENRMAPKLSPEIDELFKDMNLTKTVSSLTF